MSDAGATKAQLRAALTARPGPTQVPDLSALLALPELVAASRVAAFVSLPSEPSTLALRSHLIGRGTEVVLPVLAADSSLRWAHDDGVLEPGRFGLLSPKGAAVPISSAGAVIVPALAVTADGRRLGRGGGSYDRALAEYRAGDGAGLVVAWVLERDLCDELPVEPHDQRVDAIVTERRVLRCS